MSAAMKKQQKGREPMRTCRECGATRPDSQMKVAGGAFLRWMEFVCAPFCEHFDKPKPPRTSTTQQEPKK